MLKDFIEHVLKGILLALLYFEITLANDTTLKNIVIFLFFYISMIYGAISTGIEPSVITSAFLTKAVFSLVDQRITKKEEKEIVV